MSASSPTRQRSAMVIKQMREDKVPDLLNELLMFLTREKPSDPLQSLVDLLEAKSESESAEYTTSTSSVLGGGEAGQTTTQNLPPSPIGTPRGGQPNKGDDNGGVTVTNSNAFNINLGGAAMPQACGSPIGMLGQRQNRAANIGPLGGGKVSFLSDSNDKTNEKKKENGRESPSPNAPLQPPSGLRRDRTLIGATQTLGQDARRIVGLIERETERHMSEWGIPFSTLPFAHTSTGTPLAAAGRVVGRLVRPTDADAVHKYEADANSADSNAMLLLALASESHYLLMDTLSDVSRRNEDVSTAMVVTGRSGGVGLLGGVMATAAAAALASLLDQEERENNNNNNYHNTANGVSVTKKSSNMFDDIIGAGLGFGGPAQLAASGSDSEEDEEEGVAAQRGGKRSSKKKKKYRPITINDAHSRTIRSTNMTNVTTSGPQSHGGNPSTAAAIKSINSTLTGGEVIRGGGAVTGAHSHQPTTTYLLNASAEDGGNTSSDGYSTPGNFFSYGFGGDSPYRSPRSARGGLFGGERLFGGGEEGGKRWIEIEDILHDIYKEKDALLSLTSASNAGAGEQNSVIRLLLEETNASVAEILSTVDRNARLLHG